MIGLTKELIPYLKAFQEHFGVLVPLRELPATTTTDELIEVIKLSMEKNENLLPERFGYAKLDTNPTIDI